MEEMRLHRVLNFAIVRIKPIFLNSILLAFRLNRTGIDVHTKFQHFNFISSMSNWLLKSNFNIWLY